MPRQQKFSSFTYELEYSHICSHMCVPIFAFALFARKLSANKTMAESGERAKMLTTANKTTRFADTARLLPPAVQPTKKAHQQFQEQYLSRNKLEHDGCSCLNFDNVTVVCAQAAGERQCRRSGGTGQKPSANQTKNIRGLLFTPIL